MDDARMDETEMSDLEIVQRPSRRIWILVWIFAAAAALAIHLGGVGLAAYLQPDDSDTELGTEAIEVGLEMTSPHLEPTDLPAGPDADASAASPALAEQKAVVKETELPKEVPTETEDPDRVVAPNDSQKPKEDDPKVAATPTSASTESVAQEAMATPSVEDVPEGRSQAPAQGSGKSLQILQASWAAKLSAHFEKHKRSPVVPKFKNVKVLVNLTIDRLGHVISTSVVESSGDPAYDEAALAMIRRSDPVPPPPPLLADEGLSYTLPVVFRVKGG
jgi:periplasmic protein TonB